MANENSKIKNIDEEINALLGDEDTSVENPVDDAVIPAEKPVDKTDVPAKNTSKKGTGKKSSEQVADEAEDAIKKAAAAAALEAAVEANSKASFTNAEKTYIINKKKYMLNKCKEDEVVTFVGNAVYAQYFGKVYSFMFNTIPVTVKFDGSKQEFPKFIYDEIMDRIAKVSKASTPIEVNEKLS